MDDAGQAHTVQSILELARHHSAVMERFFADSSSQINASATTLIDALKAGRKLLFFGNGGSVANDFDFSRIFARQVEALGRSRDVAVGLSTSGRSANVLERLKAARHGGMVTVGFTGAGSGVMRELCDHLLSVPSTDTPRIQEAHILAGHILCQLVDDAFEPKNEAPPASR